MPKRSPSYDPASDPTGWLVGIIAALALLAIGYLVLSAQPARASDLVGIERGTYLLHADGSANCTAQAIETDNGPLLLTANHCVDDKDAVYSITRTTFDTVKFDKKVFEAVYFLDVFRRDKNADTAVLRPIDRSLELDTVDLASSDEAKAALISGANVLIAGFPNTSVAPMGDLLFTDGRYVGLSRSYEPGLDGTFYRTTGSVHYGNSSGGLYIEVGDTWKLVGVTSQLDPERKWVGSLFANIDAIEKNVRLTPKPATDK